MISANMSRCLNSLLGIAKFIIVFFLFVVTPALIYEHIHPKEEKVHEFVYEIILRLDKTIEVKDRMGSGNVLEIVSLTQSGTAMTGDNLFFSELLGVPISFSSDLCFSQSITFDGQEDKTIKLPILLTIQSDGDDIKQYVLGQYDTCIENRFGLEITPPMPGIKENDYKEIFQEVGSMTINNKRYRVKVVINEGIISFTPLDPEPFIVGSGGFIESWVSQPKLLQKVVVTKKPDKFESLIALFVIFSGWWIISFKFTSNGKKILKMIGC